MSSPWSDWIARHQVLAFYLLLFGVSWPAMILMFYVFPENMAMQGLLGVTATFSPVLTALYVSASSDRGAKQARSSTRWLVFLGGWLVTWVVLVLHTWQIRQAPLDPQMIIPSGIVALLPGWLISCAFSRISGVRQVFGTLLRPRGHWVWYAIALLTFPVIQLAGAGITVLIGGEVTWGISEMTASGATVFVALTFFQGLLATGGINEETGWRGFVLPRLQTKFPVLAAVIIVWFFWALWHIPYDIGTGASLESVLINRIFHNFMWAVLFAWVYNRTKGSVLAPVLFHPAMNTFSDSLPHSHAATVMFALLTLAVIYFEKMWKRLPAGNPAAQA